MSSINPEVRGLRSIAELIGTSRHDAIRLIKQGALPCVQQVKGQFVGDRRKLLAYGLSNPNATRRVARWRRWTIDELLGSCEEKCPASAATDPGSFQPHSIGME